MYSSGRAGDSLSMTFNQPNLDVIYLENPAFGTFNIVIDDTVVKRVSATASRSVFNVRVRIRNLSNTTHRLQIVATHGTIAIEAVELIPTANDGPGDNRPRPRAFEASPTPAPTQPNASTPTMENPDGGVTGTFGLPFVDQFNAQNYWQPKGNWQLTETNDGRGKSWFASAEKRNQLSTLKSTVFFDLHASTHPQLEFWQRGNLGGGDSVSVLLEIDGNGQWQLIDLQPDLVSDWQPRKLDLSQYKDHVVRLQFVLAATPAAANQANGFWLGQITLSDQPVAATAVPTNVPTTVPTDVPTNVPATQPPSPTAVPTDVPTNTAVPTATQVEPSPEPPTATLEPTTVPTNTSEPATPAQ